VDYLSTHESVKAGPLGVVGYCFTGGVALRYAAARPDKIAAAASFHGGRLYTDAPTSPHLVLPNVKARLYFGHADKDNSMPEAAIQKLDAALESWGGRYQSELYAGAAHGWTHPDGPVYNQDAAERAFGKLTALFGAELA
jgi:carboxymethylenebutenolidase